MSSPDKAGPTPSTQPPAKPEWPTLPPNVTIFSPSTPTAAKALLGGKIFSRLTASAHTEPSTLAAALKARADVHESFCLTHRNVVLVFDDGGGADAHHEHVRAVCLALKETGDIGLDIAGCVFDAPEAVRAGFQCEELSGGAVMVVDIMGGEDEDSDDEEDGLEALLKGGEVIE